MQAARVAQQKTEDGNGTEKKHRHTFVVETRVRDENSAKMAAPKLRNLFPVGYRSYMYTWDAEGTFVTYVTRVTWDGLSSS